MATVAVDNALPDGWEEVTDDDGNVYYYNSKTKVSQWDKPHAKMNQLIRF